MILATLTPDQGLLLLKWFGIFIVFWCCCDAIQDMWTTYCKYRWGRGDDDAD